MKIFDENKSFYFYQIFSSNIFMFMQKFIIFQSFLTRVSLYFPSLCSSEKAKGFSLCSWTV